MPVAIECATPVVKHNLGWRMWIKETKEIVDPYYLNEGSFLFSASSIKAIGLCASEKEQNSGIKNSCSLLTVQFLFVQVTLLVAVTIARWSFVQLTSIESLRSHFSLSLLLPSAIKLTQVYTITSCNWVIEIQVNYTCFDIHSVIKLKWNTQWRGETTALLVVRKNNFFSFARTNWTRAQFDRTTRTMVTINEVVMTVSTVVTHVGWWVVNFRRWRRLSRRRWMVRCIWNILLSRVQLFLFPLLTPFCATILEPNLMI